MCVCTIADDRTKEKKNSDTKKFFLQGIVF